MADRFKAVLVDEPVVHEETQADREARLVAGRQAREELFTELEMFAGLVGTIDAVHEPGALCLEVKGRKLRFIALEESDEVSVRFDSEGPDDHRLYRERGLADRWVWARRRRGTDQEELLPLFDAGLEELTVRALGLPRPAPEQRPMSLRTAEALVRPVEERGSKHVARPVAPRDTPAAPPAPADRPNPPEGKPRRL